MKKARQKPLKKKSGSGQIILSKPFSELAACQGDIQPVLPAGIPLKSIFEYLFKSLLTPFPNSSYEEREL